MEFVVRQLEKAVIICFSQTKNFYGDVLLASRTSKRGEIFMKKILLALIFVVSLSFAAYAEEIDSVWGLKFGMTPQVVNQLLSKKDARIVCEYDYQPDYCEAIYQVNFFGRQGHLLLRFSKKGLFLARFAFVRVNRLRTEAKAPAKAEPAPKNNVVDARSAMGAPDIPEPEKNKFEFSRNFIQLRSMLTKKYGVPGEEFKENDNTRGFRWTTGRRTITLYEGRSITKNDTVMTYEDSSRR